ncbi:MAG: FG-GAP-like repeat-containing protein [Candidatus Acetothermia bacterium]|jgi:hypothetical protein|nr:FG-GAP-like repeat-containing protein [Candidatus Acetothermia bacterium]MDH7505020.1 FG-GAP-like repeat-containing protein [Candidatus Acetothermia bacterium]
MRRILLRAVLLSVLTLLLCGAALGQGGGRIPVGEHPRSIAVLDCNRDGWDDFVVGNELSNDITIAVAQRNGFFQVTTLPTPAIIPMATAAGDLDSDSDKDLVLVACGLAVETAHSEVTGVYVTKAFNVFTFENNGSCGFSLKHKLRAGDCPSAVALADLNRNHKLDIIVVNSESRSLTLFIDVTGIPPVEVSLADCAQPVALDIGDINRDAIPDAVVACSESDTVWALLGTGAPPFFVLPPAQVIATGERPMDVELADINGDTILDLVVAHFESDKVWTFFGDGTGLFGDATLQNSRIAAGSFKKGQPHATYHVDQAPSALLLRDFNQDGMLDMVVTNAYADDVWLLCGRHDERSNKGDFVSGGKWPVGEKPVALASGDFDAVRDGWLDIVVANELSNDVSILLGRPREWCYEFLPPPENKPPVADFSYSPAQPKAGEKVRFDGSSSSDPDGQVISWSWDFGDGKTGTGKIVEHTFEKEGQYKVCLTVKDDKGAEGQACEDLTVGPPPPPPATKLPTVGDEPSGLASGDFNGDRKEDLAVVNQNSNNLSVLLGSGDGKFSPGGTVATGRGPSAVVSADFNKDNQLDLAVSNAGSNTVSILIGDGKGGFHGRGELAVGSNPMGLAFEDFDKDGKLDLALANSGANNVSILLGNGDGSFKEARNTEPIGNSPEKLAPADLNGDGKVDLAVASLNSGEIFILLGNGDGTFAVGTKLAGLNHPRGLTIDDFNNDGKKDIAVAVSDANTVALFLGKGDGSFEEPLSAKVGDSPRTLVAGKFNADANLDLAVANYTSGNVSILLGKGDGSFEEQKLFKVGEKPNGIVAGKFNADANVDLAVANAGSDNVTILLGKGDGSFEDPPLSFIGSAWSGVLVGGLGSLVFFPLLLWLWALWTSDDRRRALWAKLGLRR